LGANVRVVDPHNVEKAWTGGSPEEHARAQAAAKAEAVRAQVPDGYLVAADTIVAACGAVLEKPHDAADAAAMLRTLSGRTHHVLTALAVAQASTAPLHLAVESTAVTFTELSEEEIARYVASGEPLDKAGAYGIQGYASVFVRKIEGCYYNVVGLPLPLLYRMLRDISAT
jgi:septum formation protein